MRLYDVGSRFARVHLSTLAERAVYLVLVCDRSEAWSAEEIALLKHVDQAEIERALTGFASAGIVKAEEGEPTRYRWSASMDHLVSESDGVHIDPVCGMRVVADSPYFVKDARGATVWFCSPLCRAAFIGFPNSFTSRGRIEQENDAPVSLRGSADQAG